MARVCRSDITQFNTCHLYISNLNFEREYLLPEYALLVTPKYITLASARGSAGKGVGYRDQLPCL